MNSKAWQAGRKAAHRNGLTTVWSRQQVNLAAWNYAEPRSKNRFGLRKMVDHFNEGYKVGYREVSQRRGIMKGITWLDSTATKTSLALKAGQGVSCKVVRKGGPRSIGGRVKFSDGKLFVVQWSDGRTQALVHVD